MGFQYQNQLLNTTMQKGIDDNLEIPGTDFMNHLSLNRVKGYFQTNIHYNFKKLKASLRLPVSFVLIKLSDSEHKKYQQVKKFLTEPRLFVEYDINAYWKFTGNAGYHIRFGTNNQVYFGYILHNYQLLQIRNVPIPETRSQQYAVKAEYSNPLNSLFANIGYNFSVAEQNLIYQSRISDKGAVILSAKEQGNSEVTHRISGYVSYYFSQGKTTFSLETNVTLNRGEQIVNDAISRVDNRIVMLKPKINVRCWSWLNVEYKGNFSLFRTKINGDDIDRFSQNRNYINLNFFPNNANYVGLSSETNKISFSGQKSLNYFADIVYRYGFKKKKIDLEVRWNNVFNHVKYESVYINSFVLTRTAYELRPSQVLFSIRFSF